MRWNGDKNWKRKIVGGRNVVMFTEHERKVIFEVVGEFILEIWWDF